MSRQAAAPARCPHRLAEVFEDLEQQRAGDTLAVQRRMQTLTVVVGGKRAAYVLRGRECFTAWAQARYDADREMAEASGTA